MPRVAVTGGTGFVGANLVRRLVADGHEVHVLTRGEHGAWRLKGVREAVSVHHVDLQDRDRLVELVGELAFESVFHLAAHGAYPWQTDAMAIRGTNVVGTDNLLHACAAAGVPTLVHTGSSSEYGARDHAPAEDEPVEPNSYYGLTKAWATMACRFAGFTTLRLYSVYGPWEDPRRFVPQLITHGLAGGLPPLAHPATARDFVYVDDVVDALVLAARVPAPGPTEPGPVYNVGTGVQTTLREAVVAAGEELAIDAEPAWDSMAPRPWDTEVWVADARRIERDLGWRPRTTFAEGLARTVDWHRSLSAHDAP
jgi:dolichol-phosphate mannosyltransferase